MSSLSFRGDNILNVGEPKDISTAKPQSQSHTAIFFLNSSWQDSACFSLFFFFFDSHCHLLYLLEVCYPPRRKAEVCEVWLFWTFIYLSLTNYTEFFCFKYFTINSSGKNIAKIKITNMGGWGRLQTFTKFLQSYSLGGGSWLSSENRNLKFPFELCSVILFLRVRLIQCHFSSDPSIE